MSNFFIYFGFGLLCGALIHPFWIALLTTIIGVFIIEKIIEK